MFPHQASIDSLKAMMKQVRDVLEKDILQKNKYVYDAYNSTTQPYFDNIHDIILELEQLPLQYLPSNEAHGEIWAPISQIDTVLKRLSTTIDGIPSDYNQAAPQVSSLQHEIQLIKNEEPKLSKAAGLYIPYLVYKQGNYAQIIKELNEIKEEERKQQLELFSKLNQRIEEAQKKIEQDSKEIEDIRKHSQESAAEIGIVPFAQDFESEYKERKNAAKWWLITTAIFTIITAIVIFYLYSINLNTKFEYNQIAIQVSMIALLFSVVIWCSRMYRISMHQVVVNKHRALSLRTFQTFISSTSDQHVKDAVLMEATRTIFNQGHTGYIDPKSDGSDSDTKVVEIIKNQNLLK